MARRGSRTVRGHPPGAVKQRQVDRFRRQAGQKVGQGGQDRRADAPAIPVAHPEQHGPTNHLGRRLGGGEQAVNRLAQHQFQIVGHGLVETAAPALRIVPRPVVPDPQPAVPFFHREHGHVVGPGIEGAAARQFETGMMPMARQDAVVHGAPMERKAQVGAAVVHREDTSIMAQDQDRAARSLDDQMSIFLEFVDGAGVDLVAGLVIHRCAFRRVPWPAPLNSPALDR